MTTEISLEECDFNVEVVEGQLMLYVTLYKNQRSESFNIGFRATERYFGSENEPPLNEQQMALLYWAVYSKTIRST